MPQAPETHSVILEAIMTSLGAVAVAVTRGKLVGVAFGHRSPAAAASALAKRTNAFSAGTCAERDQQLADAILERLAAYAQGDPVDFRDLPVELDHLSPFQRRVVKACRAIPAGQRKTYGQLAAQAGSPGAARAVGQVMATNRMPLVVPCHRVVAAGGRLGGFSAPQGLAMKRRLLAMEAALSSPHELFD